ncbi:MAG: flavin reductase [Armatimonadetes bacterium]|nr:MAG: flavin reductase [Armatimonadota bacterium]
MEDTVMDGEDFKEAMSHYAGSVEIVTVNTPDGPVGITVSAFVSVSVDPPIVLVCVDKVAGSLDAMLAADGYTVNFMPEGTEATAMVFATRGADKFGLVEWSDPVTSVAGPVLAEAFQVFECETIKRTEMGDHWVLYGKVRYGTVGDAKPLIYLNRAFAKLR